MTEPLTQRRDLGAFLRAHREKLTPAALGLPGGGRRRTPGLRREEVAQLAGLSATWYSWIEQGRDVAMSAAALARLAASLQLGRAERAYLFELAGKRDPASERDAAEALPQAALASVDRIACPAYILDRAWNALRWNAPAARLFVGWLDRPGEHNLLRYIFLSRAAKSLIKDWPERAQRVAAEFRAANGAHLHDPALRALIDGLKRESPSFARFWDEQHVLEREGGERTFNHPAEGFLAYEQVSFTLAGHPDLKLTMLLEERRSTHQQARVKAIEREVAKTGRTHP